MMPTSPLDPHKPGLFNGVYSYQEAGRLLGVPSKRVGRWADGYTFEGRHGRRESGPILRTSRYRGVLSFQELVELFFVREYVNMGVHLSHVRDTAVALEPELGRYPFASADLPVNGRELIVATAEDQLHRPDIGQVIASFAATMVKRVDFEEGMISRYRPPDFEDRVFLDLNIRSGEAVVGDYAIPTRSVYSLWKKERQKTSVASYFAITNQDVSLAVRYEAAWRQAA